MTNERASANDTGLHACNFWHGIKSRDLTTAQSRMDWFAAHFEVKPAALELNEQGDVILTDELLEFCDREGVSLDWIILGDVAGLVAAHREKYRQEREFVQLMKPLSDGEKNALTIVLKMTMEDGVDIKEALAVWRDIGRKPEILAAKG